MQIVFLLPLLTAALDFGLWIFDCGILPLLTAAYNFGLLLPLPPAAY